MFKFLEKTFQRVFDNPLVVAILAIVFVGLAWLVGLIMSLAVPASLIYFTFWAFKHFFG